MKVNRELKKRYIYTKTQGFDFGALEEHLSFWEDLNKDTYEYKFRKIPEEKHIEYNPYEELATAIVKRAIVDFLDVAEIILKRKGEIPKEEEDFWVKQFSSEWFESLSGVDGRKLYDTILEQLKSHMKTNLYGYHYWKQKFM